MRCEQCQAVLEEYFDGELAQPIAKSVAAHLQTCVACSDALQQLISEQQVYSNYEHGLEISPTMWGDVRSQIAATPPIRSFERFSNRFRALFAFTPINAATTVALVLLAVAATVGVMKYLNRHSPEQIAFSNLDGKVVPNPTLAVSSKTPDAVRQSDKASKLEAVERPERPIIKPQPRRESSNQATTAAELVRQAEQKYLSAIALLHRDMRRRPSRIDADTKARFEGALADIDRTIASTRAAVRKDPNDPVTVQYMLSAYRKKVDVLREMTSY